MKGLLYLRSLPLLLCLIVSHAFAQNNTIMCPVFQDNYATGSCNANTKTQVSLMKAYAANGERAWAKFDISNVPDSINITSVKVHYYIYNQNYPYYLITKLLADPVTTAAPNLYSVIGQASASNTNPNTYLIYNNQAVNGWNIMSLNSYAKNDLLNALAQNWFAVGFYEYESSGGYNLEAHGWNEQYKPYLEISYTPLSLNNDLAITAITSPSDYSCEDTIPVQAIIYNNGTNTITSALLHVSRFNQFMGSYNYTSSGLLPGQYDTVNLGNYGFPYGYNQVAVAVSTVNTFTDPNFVNNAQTVYFSVFEPATITLQPQDQSVLVGANVIFSTEVSAYYYHSFQWQLSTDGGTTFTDLVSGYPYYYVDSSQLHVFHVESGMNGYLFRCRIETPCETLLTNAALLTVNQGPLTISNTWPSYDSVCAGSTVQLFVSVSGGTGNYTYSWTSDPQGFTSTSSDPHVTPSVSTQYFVVVSDGQTSVTSTCWVHILSTPSPAVSITGPSNVCRGQSTVTYSTPYIQGATYYYWTVPSGLTYSYTGNTITVTVGPNAISGNITVSGHNQCGMGQSATFPVIVNATPVVNAGADQTITAGTSATITAYAYNGTAPYTFTWSNGMTGAAITVNPTVTTTYYVTVTDQNGCTGTDHVVISVIASTQISTVPASINQCPGTIHVPIYVTNFVGVASLSLSLLYDTNHLQYTGYQDVNMNLNAGILLVNNTPGDVHIAWFSVNPASIGWGTILTLNFIADTGISMLHWDLQTQGACQYTNINNATIPAVFYTSDVVIQPCSNVEGFVYYNNNIHSPMTQTPVYLMQQGNVVYQTVTDTSGHYSFSNPNNGIYEAKAAPNKPWGSVNASDALMILKHFVNMVTLTGITYHAGDVDNSSVLNSVDALMVAKRFVNMISSFPAGNWVSQGVTVNVNGLGNVYDSIAVLCTGDVDRSYIPAGLKSAPTVEVTSIGEQTDNPGNDIIIPFYVGENLVTSSLSLVLDIPSDNIYAVDVVMNSDIPAIYNFSNHQLRIAWYSLNPLDLKSGDLLFTLICKADNLNDEFMITAGLGSVMTDRQGDPYPMVSLGYKLPKRTGIADFMGNCTPNPAEDRTVIHYMMSESGKVSMGLYDITGKCLLTPISEEKPAGQYTAEISLLGLAPGTYLIRMTVNHGDKVYHENRRLLKK